MQLGCLLCADAEHPAHQILNLQQATQSFQVGCEMSATMHTVIYIYHVHPLSTATATATATTNHIIP